MPEEKAIIEALKEKVSVYKETVKALDEAQGAVVKYRSYQSSIEELAEKVLLQNDLYVYKKVRGLYSEADTLTGMAEKRAALINKVLAGQILEIIDMIAAL